MTRKLCDRGILWALAALLIVVSFNANATTIDLTPGNSDFSGSSPNNPNADDVETITGASMLTEAYKDNVGGSEEGPFSSSYMTTYFNSPSDPEDALIEYVTGSHVTGDVIYLLAKDGNQDPIWYIWDISTWDGMMDLSATGLWPQQGAISHMSIFAGEDGGGGGQVPEPAALVLIATGLLCMGLVGRGRRQA